MKMYKLLHIPTATTNITTSECKKDMSHILKEYKEEFPDNTIILTDHETKFYFGGEYAAVDKAIKCRLEEFEIIEVEDEEV